MDLTAQELNDLTIQQDELFSQVGMILVEFQLGNRKNLESFMKSLEDFAIPLYEKFGNVKDETLRYNLQLILQKCDALEICLLNVGDQSPSKITKQMGRMGDLDHDHPLVKRKPMHMI